MKLTYFNIKPFPGNGIGFYLFLGAKNVKKDILIIFSAIYRKKVSNWLTKE